MRAFLFFSRNTFSQETPPVYPKVAGYFSVVHVLATVSKNETVTNFSPAYTVGLPSGVNILKSDKIAFSFEITPFIKTENGSSKMSNILLHPGVVFRFKNGFSITERAAFETNGRFGETTVFTKVVRRYKLSNLFLAMPLPVRLGNDKPISIGVGIQVGLSF